MPNAPVKKLRADQAVKAASKIRARTKVPDPLTDAIGVTALAKSQKAEGHRDLLKPGVHAVSLAVIGTIDGKNWSRRVDGNLVIAADSAPSASSSTPWAELLHAALCLVPETQRRGFLASVVQGDVPRPACGEDKLQAVAAELKPALESYRATKPAAKRGTVSFIPAPV